MIIISDYCLSGVLGIFVLLQFRRGVGQNFIGMQKTKYCQIEKNFLVTGVKANELYYLGQQLIRVLLSDK